MLLDIRPGDLLTVEGTDYPIKSAADYSGRGVTPTLRRQATLPAYTKRTATTSGGKRGNPEIHIAGLRATPLDPVDAELKQRLGLETPHQVRQTFLALEGDCAFYHLVVEDLA
jgi:hypothetical protein